MSWPNFSLFILNMPLYKLNSSDFTTLVLTESLMNFFWVSPLSQTCLFVRKSLLFSTPSVPSSLTHTPSPLHTRWLHIEQTSWITSPPTLQFHFYFNSIISAAAYNCGRLLCLTFKLRCTVFNLYVITTRSHIQINST